jgi:hypothetical protein
MLEKSGERMEEEVRLLAQAESASTATPQRSNVLKRRGLIGKARSN